LKSICSSLTKRSALADKIVWFVATSRSVIIIVTCTLVFAIIGDTTLVSFVGNVHQGLPPFRLPPFVYHIPLNHTIESVHPVRPEWRIFTAFDMLREDSSALVVIPLLALMEHYTSAKMFAGAHRVDASQEMIAIGISNILSRCVVL
jgi:sodium-independent sulfate anion transporter 11